MTALATRDIETHDDAREVATVLAGSFAAGAVARERDRRLPHEEVGQLAASGLLALSVPRQYGGPGLPPSTVAEVLRIIAGADANLAQIPHSHFVYLNLIRLSASEEQQERFFTRVLRGQLFANAQSERSSATATQISTTLQPDPRGVLRLSGEKYYCTGTLYADTIPVLAHVPEANPWFGAGDHVVFLDATTEGIAISDDWDAIGQRLTASGTVTLDGVAVDPGDVVPRATALEQDLGYGAYAQLLHAAIDVGIAGGAFTAAVDFVRTKARPWADAGVERAEEDPLTIQRIGELRVALTAAEATLERAAAAVDRVTASPNREDAVRASLDVACAKVTGEKAALEISSGLFEVGGTRAAAGPERLDRFWRNARTHTLHDPVRWKYQHLGRHALTGQAPSRSGQF